MKKFLFIGALLALSATSFGGVSEELIKDPSPATTVSGSANLRLETRGNVIDATDKAVLMITPIASAGPDGQSLTFDFGSVVAERSTSLTGKFLVEVITKDKTANKIKAIPITDQNVKITLQDKNTQKGKTILKDLELKNIADEKVGSLGYQLSTVYDNTKATGIVVATVTPEKTNTGAFVNNDGEVHVEVKGLTFPPK